MQTSNRFQLSALTLALYGLSSVAIAADNPQTDNIEVQNRINKTQVSHKKDLTKTNDITSEAVERIEVTGSRLQYGNMTSRELVIDAEEIKARGVTSVEELIRTLPQNLASIGSITNERTRGPLADRDQASVGRLGSLGVSAANLGGVGAGQTLVLINGRRIAGAAGIEDGFVNLNGIPLSAIERVEISLDGASAIYGADAMGGVINFILRSNFSGSTISLQHEESANDADNSRISLFSGHTWTSGNVSLSVEHSKRDPVNNYKSGFTTLDYSDYYDDINYDFRQFTNGLQPGLIQYGMYDADGNWISTGIKLPNGTNGRPDIADFVPLTDDDKLDYVPKYAGPKSNSTSVTLNAEQKLTEHFSTFFNGMYTRGDYSRELTYNTQALELSMAPGQYYNPFPSGYFAQYTYADYATVQYRPADEVATGVLPSGRIKSTKTQWNFNWGLSYEFNRETKLDFVYSKSGSSSKGDDYSLSSMVSYLADPNSASGMACYNGAIAEGSYTDAELEYYQGVFDKQCLALTSNDPNIAFNPWKSTAESSGGSIMDFYVRNDTDTRSSSMDNYELRLNGAAFELPAGKIYYAVGAEWHDSGVSSKEVKKFTGNEVSRDMYALFGEMSIPVFSRKFNIPGAHTLTLSLAARRDMTKTKGAIGTVDGAVYEPGVPLVYGDNTFARTTPSLGFYWEPIPEVSVRGRWSEGFKAPNYTAMFNLAGTITYPTTINNDPYYDCTAHNDCQYDFGSFKGYAAESYLAPNPDLKPETSTQESLGLGWTPSGMLAGLSVNIDYQRTKRKNEYGDLSDIFELVPTEDRLALELFYVRDETGRVIQQRQMQFNMASSEFESITYEVGYYFDTAYGSFEPKITYLDNLTMESQAFAGGEKISRLGTIGGVDDYKINGQLRYYYGDLTASLYAYYLPSYINDSMTSRSNGAIFGDQYNRKVDSYLWFDLTASYQITNSLRVNFAGRNILDSTPSFTVVENRPYDTSRYNAAGRTFSVEVQYEF
ncbi:TonB-dependent receptor [Shewanella sp. C32]|uniref:TonB-dependent receptor n=1 Tax=Shewanella electrica TaxID=515560 RepID=A0ABT2FFB0_9GAMM|nr:TonB-dependent receptor [Shewanella electrica]MCH1925080.1 TonB-dependent receptor [Shewanella electrica]MCS4554904.1 TonB-dependent receptor [Shewanella electrica]